MRPMPPSMVLDPYIPTVLMPDLVGHDRRPSAFLVYLLLWSRTQAVGRKHLTIALADLAEATGLAKRTVQHAIDWLMHRQLVEVRRDGHTDLGEYSVLTPWRRGRR